MNKWVHICITYNGNRNPDAVAIYIDGVKQEKIIAQNSLKADTIKTDKPFRIGRRFNSGQVNGTEIDEVRVYNRSLTKGEVQTMMSLPYKDMPEPKGLNFGLNFDSFKENKTQDKANPQRSFTLHGKAKQIKIQ